MYMHIWYRHAYKGARAESFAEFALIAHTIAIHSFLYFSILHCINIISTRKYSVKLMVVYMQIESYR